MNVRTLPYDDDTCGWIRILPERPAPRRLEGECTADWAILGAGYTGLAAARRIAEHDPQARVVVIDAQRAGEGASGRNSGYAVDQSTSASDVDPAYDAVVARKRRLNLAGIALLEAVVERHGIDCQWRRIGKIHAAAEPSNCAEVDAIIAVCRRLDMPFEELDAPALARRLGTDYYVRGVHTPLAVMLQPAALARGLATSLPESVTLFEESPVVRIDYGSTVRLHTRTGRISAPRLILAANAFLPALGVLTRRLAPLTLTGSLTRPLEPAERAAIGDPADWAILSAHPRGATVRYTADHRILVRNTSEFGPGRPMTATEVAQRRAVNERGLRARFPMLPDLGFEYTWTGLTCMSRNFTPFFGKVATKVFASGGYNGSGVARGTVAGSLLVDYALGADSPLLRDITAFPGPAWIPPRPLLDLGIRWRMARAGAGLGRDA